MVVLGKRSTDDHAGDVLEAAAHRRPIYPALGNEQGVSINDTPSRQKIKRLNSVNRDLTHETITRAAGGEEIRKPLYGR